MRRRQKIAAGLAVGLFGLRFWYHASMHPGQTVLASVDALLLGAAAGGFCLLPVVSVRGAALWAIMGGIGAMLFLSRVLDSLFWRYSEDFGLLTGLVVMLIFGAPSVLMWWSGRKRRS
ncbi:MAG: hypothetical protein K2X35_00110 [Bryobacteraceae bacterium]|nr:hypothetical protein [Bryobacteraceae bacterium]